MAASRNYYRLPITPDFFLRFLKDAYPSMDYGIADQYPQTKIDEDLQKCDQGFLRMEFRRAHMWTIGTKQEKADLSLASDEYIQSFYEKMQTEFKKKGVELSLAEVKFLNYITNFSAKGPFQGGLLGFPNTALTSWPAAFQKCSDDPDAIPLLMREYNVIKPAPDKLQIQIHIKEHTLDGSLPRVLFHMQLNIEHQNENFTLKIDDTTHGMYFETSLWDTITNAVASNLEKLDSKNKNDLFLLNFLSHDPAFKQRLPQNHNAIFPSQPWYTKILSHLFFPIVWAYGKGLNYGLERAIDNKKPREEWPVSEKKWAKGFMFAMTLLFDLSIFIACPLVGMQFTGFGLLEYAQWSLGALAVTWLTSAVTKFAYDRFKKPEMLLQCFSNAEIFPPSSAPDSDNAFRSTHRRVDSSLATHPPDPSHLPVYPDLADESKQHARAETVPRATTPGAGLGLPGQHPVTTEIRRNGLS